MITQSPFISALCTPDACQTYEDISRNVLCLSFANLCDWIAWILPPATAEECAPVWPAAVHLCLCPPRLTCSVRCAGTLPRYTGGQVYYYPGFTPVADGARFAWELQHDLERETAWEAVMRIRCGKGLKISSFHGHFFIRSTDLLALPCVDEDKAFAIQISHEEQLVPQQTVYFQAALLYTSSSGERRIRVHTIAAPLVADLGDMYKAADAAACINVLAKLAVEKSLSDRLEAARSVVTSKAIQALREYRQLYPAAQLRTAGGRLIYPDTLRLLPLYALAITKATPLRGGFQEVRDHRPGVLSPPRSLPGPLARVIHAGRSLGC